MDEISEFLREKYGRAGSKASFAQFFTKSRQQQRRARGILVKSPQQIMGIRKSSRLTSEILDMLEERIRPGITTEQINTWVHAYTVAHGAIPAPLNYRGYPKKRLHFYQRGDLPWHSRPAQVAGWRYSQRGRHLHFGWLLR